MSSQLSKIARYDIIPVIGLKHDWKYDSQGRTSVYIPQVELKEDEDANGTYVKWYDVADLIRSQDKEIERLNEIIAKKMWNKVP